MVARRLPSPAQMQAACDRFNAAHFVGSRILAFPGAVEGPLVEIRVAEPGAYVMGGHTAVVQVTGGYGCIALTHVRDVPVLAETL